MINDTGTESVNGKPMDQSNEMFKISGPFRLPTCMSDQRFKTDIMSVYMYMYTVNIQPFQQLKPFISWFMHI